MKIEVKEISYKKVDIELSEMKKITKHLLSRVTGVRPDCYIKNGKLFYDEEHYTSHSWYDERAIRTATKEDELIVKLFKKINELEEE